MADKLETVADIVGKWLPHFKRYADAHNESAGYDMAGDAVSALEEVLEACGQGNQQEPTKPFDPAEFENAVSNPNGWDSVPDPVAEIRRMRGDFPIGNAAKLREALDKAQDVILCAARFAELGELADVQQVDYDGALETIEAALDAPARNCDRFETWEESRRAWNDYVERNEDLPPSCATEGSFWQWLFAPVVQGGQQEGGQP